MKNVRSVLYPYDHDVWDLLAKLGAFPDTVPLLVARRLHPATFRFFSDIGALGHQTRAQWFSPQIPEDDFEATTSALRFTDARQVDPASTTPGLLKFFGQTGPTYAPASLTRWQRVAPIVDRYRKLRETNLDADYRKASWHSFAREVVDAGLYDKGGWAPKEVVEPPAELEPFIGDDW